MQQALPAHGRGQSPQPWSSLTLTAQEFCKLSGSSHSPYLGSARGEGGGPERFHPSPCLVFLNPSRGPNRCHLISISPEGASRRTGHLSRTKSKSFGSFV